MQLTTVRKSLRRMATVLACVCWAGSAGSAAQLNEPSEVVAQVGDDRISVDDLEHWQRTQDVTIYQRLRRDVYDGRRRALEALLTERLLSAEASQRGVTVDALLANEINARAKPVTPEDVAAFVADNPMPAGVTADVVAPLVTELLGTRAREVAREEYLRWLQTRPAANVRVFLEPPRVSVSRSAHNPTRGSARGPVEVVMFSDFECPFCRRAEAALTRLFQRFATDVTFVWKHYPLAMHQSARPAAEAAQCAHDQGRFWDYHDALFREGASLQPTGLLRTAERLGLDMATFGSCVAGRMHSEDVRADLQAGERAGVSGTPTVFINGVAFVGALAYDVYERAVLDELAHRRPTTTERVDGEQPR